MSTRRPRLRPILAARHLTTGTTRPDTPRADIRIGYARCGTLTQELQSRLDALAAYGIDPDKVFTEKISTRVRVCPNQAFLDRSAQQFPGAMTTDAS